MRVLAKKIFFFGAKITRDFFVKTQKYTYEFSHLTIFLWNYRIMNAEDKDDAGSIEEDFYVCFKLIFGAKITRNFSRQNTKVHLQI